MGLALINFSLVIRDVVDTKQLKTCMWSPLGCGITGDCVVESMCDACFPTCSALNGKCSQIQKKEKKIGY